MAKNIIELVKEELPENMQVSEICFEGSEIVIYTKNPDMFLQNGDFIKRIVSKIKKRIEVRPDPSISRDMEESRDIIKKLIPESAGLDEITFEPAFGRVIIEAHKPGLVIGKQGETLKSIRRETLWSPVVKRAPAIQSDVVATVRKVLHTESEFRKKFLNDVGKQIHSNDLKEIEWVRLTGFGSCREVGRSCLMLSTPNSRILLDCGIKPATEGTVFPYLQVPEFDIQGIDAIVLSHAHMDHAGSIPFLYEVGYQGPLFCTEPTRDLATLLCLDFIDVANKEGGTSPYSSKAIENMIKHTIPLKYGEVSDITRDMRITFQNAGHILGAALTHIHIGEGVHNVVYSGDYKYDKTNLFDEASTDFQRVETLITESTYGAATAIQPSKAEAEKVLIDAIKRTIERGGKVLIPSFAVGRAQELMPILARQKDLNVPVYMEGMLWDATAIHTTYIECLSKQLQDQIFKYGDNPFINPIFKRVGNQKERRELINAPDPFVAIATSGMLMGGPAVEYLKQMAEDPKNCLIFVGYQAQGSMGSKIQGGWKEIPMDEGGGRRSLLKINMEVVTVDGLSGHSDRNHLVNFVHKLKDRPRKIIINHGEESRSLDLARSLHKMFKTETIVPKNLETIRLK